MDQQKFYTSIAEYYEHIFPLNKLQVSFIEQELGELNDLHFLDAGCSTGQLANALTNQGALGIGIDLNADLISKATERYASPSLSFRTLNMLEIGANFASGYFDFVVCFGNTLVHLESITRVRDFFKQCASSLKPGGKLFIQTLNYQYIIANGITELPLIENEHIRFERYYRLPDAVQSKVEFRTVLTIKANGNELVNSTLLLPLRKNDLEPLLLASGFKSIGFFENFKHDVLSGSQLPLIISAEL